MSQTAKIILKLSVCVFLNILRKTVILNYSTIWLLTPTLTNKLYYNMCVLCLYLCVYVCCKHMPLYQNQIFKIPITFYSARRQRSSRTVELVDHTYDGRRVARRTHMSVKWFLQFQTCDLASDTMFKLLSVLHLYDKWHCRPHTCCVLTRFYC